jgi:nitrous oxidase accessory protein NosD
VSDIEVIGNRFQDLSAGGIAVDSFLDVRPADPRLVCRDILIANNLIRDIGVDYRSSVGIFAGFVSRTRIEHNEIYDAPYTGISVGWGWTDETTALGDNRIVGNRIGRAMMLMADGGGIYTLSKQPGTVIRENYVHDLIRSPWAGEFPIAGIYLDEGSSEILVSDNVLEHAPLGILFHRASHNLIINTEGSYEERNGAAHNVMRLDAGFSPEAVKKGAGLEAAYADVGASTE